MKNIGDCTAGTECKLVVSKGNSKLEFLTKIVDVGQSATKYGYYIVVEPLVYNGKPLSVKSIKGLKLCLEYRHAKDKRLYTFNVSSISHKENSGNLILYSRQTAIPVNKRRAFRVDCGYDVALTLPLVQRTVHGYVRDISYVGAAFVFADSGRTTKIGQRITGLIKCPKDDLEHSVTGTIVRIMDNWIGGKTLVGVDFFTTTRDVEKIVRDLQAEEIRRRAAKSKKVVY